MLQGAYTQIKQFLYNYTLHMSNLISNQLNQYNTPEKMTELLSNVNQYTIGYCVLFKKKT